MGDILYPNRRDFVWNSAKWLNRIRPPTFFSPAKLDIDSSDGSINNLSGEIRFNKS